jgi:hypothetical protein
VLTDDGETLGFRHDLIRQAVEELSRRLDEEQIPLEVLPGADVRIERDLVARLRSGEARQRRLWRRETGQVSTGVSCRLCAGCPEARPSGDPWRRRYPEAAID